MKSVGEKFPKFEKTAVVSLEPGKEFETLTLDNVKNGKWTVFFKHVKLNLLNFTKMFDFCITRRYKPVSKP